MRSTSALSLTSAVLAFACPANAAILFLDNFTTSGQSDDINSQYTGGRQSGTLGDLQYRQGNGAVVGGTITGTIASEASNGFKTQIGNTSAPNTLWLVGGSPSLSAGTASLEHNFNENPGSGGYLSVSFTVDPAIGAAGTSTSWAAISLGAGNNASYGTSGTGARGQSILLSAPQFSILFRDNGQFQAFDGGSQVSVGTNFYDTTPTVGTTHSIELRISGLIDGNPWDGVNDTWIDAYADGGPTPFYSFSKTGGYTDNFITLLGEGDSSSLAISQFDNFQVAIIPEPGAALLGGIGLLSLLRRRRA